MNKLSCAAVLLALGFCGSVSATGTHARTDRAAALPASYWHCIYQSDNGGVYEFLSRSRCAPTVDHNVYGYLTLIDAYFGPVQ